MTDRKYSAMLSGAEDCAFNLLFERRTNLSTSSVESCRKRFLQTYPTYGYIFEKALVEIQSSGILRRYP